MVFQFGRLGQKYELISSYCSSEAEVVLRFLAEVVLCFIAGVVLRFWSLTKELVCLLKLRRLYFCHTYWHVHACTESRKV